MNPLKIRIQLSLIVISLLGFINATAQDIDPWLETKSENAIDLLKEKNWQMGVIMEDAYGYAIFPSIGKAGIGIGGAHGRGLLYEDGQAVGMAKMTQLSVGFQWGGQSYCEIILFENEKAMEMFKSSKLEFAAQASAIIVTAGVSTDVPYNNGVAIYTVPKGGFMYEAAIGGQKFKYISESDSSK